MLLALALAAHAAPVVADRDDLDGPDGAAPPEESAPIINGEPASADVYPMTGGVILDMSMEFGGQAYDLRMFTCSSTLIAPDVVALAAHCLDSDAFTYGQGEVTFNEARWTRNADLTAWSGYDMADWPEDASVAWDWVTHPDFDIWTMSMGLGENSDVALIFLEEPVLDVPYARLPVDPDEQALLVEGASVDIVGWGQQTATSGYEMPPEGTYALKMWGTSVVGEVGEFELQVGPNAQDVRKCHGDSGGPTFQTVAEGEFRLVGITSHAYDSTDCDRKGGVDTRVDAYLEWIDAEMRARCEDGTRSWCEEEGIPTGASAEPEDTGDTGGGDPLADEEEKGGCACSASAGAAGRVAWMGALGALGLVAALRRRRA